MTALLTGPDSLREFLTGAAADGDPQDDTDLSFGNYRSSFEAASFAIYIANALDGVKIQIASAGNSDGIGILTSPDGFSLRWQAPGALIPGPVVEFAIGQTTVLIVPGANPSQFLRIEGTPPFSVASSLITLTTLLENVFGFNNVFDADASAGINQYRATILRNESDAGVSELFRWLELKGTIQVSDIVQLGGSGAGTIQTSGSFADWPTTGWCRIDDVGGTTREVIYYASRTEYVLNVTADGRGQFGSIVGAGAASDTLNPIPGIAIGFDSLGLQISGQPISAPPDDTTSPGVVVWNQRTEKAFGLHLPVLPLGFQIGFWIWRQIPPNCVFSPNVYNGIQTDFFAF